MNQERTNRGRRQAMIGLGLLAAVMSPALADGTAKQEGAGKAETKSAVADERDRVERASKTLEDALTGEDAAIPVALLKEAHGIVVIPNVIKGGLVVGGQYGKGLASWRDEGGAWSTPTFVGMGGASYGFQAGVESVDLILVVTDENGLQALLEDGLKLGAGIGVTAGPIGRNAEMGVNVTLDSGIYSYSRAKGLFAGATLEGAVITIDDGANADAYGNGITGQTLLERSVDVAAPELVRPFIDTLHRHVPEMES